MDAAGLARVDEQLESFVGEVFSPLGRKDRRASEGLYMRGLMLEGRRDSMQPMAQRLRVDHQRLQQFVTSSPWDVEPVRKTLSRKACTLIEPDAWVIDDTRFVKDGDASACVACQCSGTLGKVDNRQIAVSVHATVGGERWWRSSSGSGSGGSVPAGWSADTALCGSMGRNDPMATKHGCALDYGRSPSNIRGGASARRMPSSSPKVWLSIANARINYGKTHGCNVYRRTQAAAPEEQCGPTAHDRGPLDHV